MVYAIRIFSARPEVTEIKISISLPSDSIEALKTSAETIHTLQDLSATIANQEKELHQYYEMFIKARQDDADMFKMLTILGALIIAFGSFFGIKNLKDFKDNISEEAIKTAADRVDVITKETLKSTVSTQIKRNLDTDVFYLDMKSRIQEDIVTTFLPSIHQDIDNLKEKVKSIDKKDNPEEDGSESQRALEQHSEEVINHEALESVDDEDIMPIPEEPNDI